MEMKIDVKIHYYETNTFQEDMVDRFKLHEKLIGPQVRWGGGVYKYNHAPLL